MQFYEFYEYGDDILSHLYSIESHYLPRLSMINQQPEIFWDQRLELLDYLVCAHAITQLSSATLFLAINIFDRYSSKRKVHDERFRLLGCTCLWIAAKYCEVEENVPTISDIIEISNTSHTRRLYYATELDILTTLKWSISSPTIDKFVDLSLADTFFKTHQDISSMRHVAFYLAEKALYCQSLMFISPSVVANCALHLARFYLYGTKMPKMPCTEDEICLKLLFNASIEKRKCVDFKYEVKELSEASVRVRDYKRSVLQATRKKGYANDSNQSFGVIKKITQDATQLNQTSYLYITTGLWQAMFKPQSREE